MNRPKILSHTIPVSLTMCPPAVRCVIVLAWAPTRFDATEGPDALGNWPDERSSHRVIPVLAIVAKHERLYNRHNDGERRPETAPTHEGMEALGWYYEATHLETDMMIHDEDYGLCPASMAMNATNTASRFVVTPWPPEEDEARLASVVAELRAEARAKVARGPHAIAKSPEAAAHAR